MPFVYATLIQASLLVNQEVLIFSSAMLELNFEMLLLRKLTG
ncbi:hypothetical protein SOVF_012250 [Spinacia oleracea]|nr:hypothetical protein SOVF_012250 [Spinacia oleracea]